MGQLLCSAMIAAGIILLVRFKHMASVQTKG
jgi:hypothetical protein